MWAPVPNVSKTPGDWKTSSSQAHARSNRPRLAAPDLLAADIVPSSDHCDSNSQRASRFQLVPRGQCGQNRICGDYFRIGGDSPGTRKPSGRVATSNRAEVAGIDRLAGRVQYDTTSAANLASGSSDWTPSPDDR